MRIEYLHMKNFAPIFVVMDKTDVYLDYRACEGKVINIFVGQMGSCKTFLLGHHQPFATLGALDVRNADDMVLPDKKGVKEIVYRDGDDLFEIIHYYLPTKNGHSVKSYIKKNGVELNENGNNSSFKQIIEVEFGLDQNFLKLFRIGSNVTNLPEMTSTERKNFISSMLSDADVYTMLYKKIGDENRSINAQMTMLINKLHSISKRTEEDIAKDLDMEDAIVGDIRRDADNALKEIYQLEANIMALRGDKSEAAYLSYLIQLESQCSGISSEMASIESQLDEIKDCPDPAELNRTIAQLHAQIEIRSKQMMDLEKKIGEDDRQIKKLQDQLLVMGDENHIQTLRTTYDQLMGILNEYETRLDHFTYTGTAGTIANLTAEAQNLAMLIADLAQYDVEDLQKVIRNPKGAQAMAEREVNKAQAEKARVRQEMDNMASITTYTTTHTMVRPFNCPTADCPYFKHHPITEQAKRKGKDIDAKYLEKRNRINQLDAIILRYEEYQNIARKVATTRTIWKSLIPSLRDVGAIVDDDFETVVTNILHRTFYDQKRLDRIRELCGLREKYYELSQRVAGMRNDLARYDNSDAASIQKGLRTLTKRYNEELSQFEELEKANATDTKALDENNEAYLKVSNKEMLTRRLESLQLQYASVSKDRDIAKANDASIREYSNRLTELHKKAAELEGSYKLHRQELEKLQRTLADIRLTKEQYQEVLDRQGLIHDVLDAVSSKKGIPLVLVKLFLAECKDDLNDLISAVFDDAIEIQDFNIPDDGSDFIIPYTRNGRLIGDIVKSSQGEGAVISLALSFALIRQASFKYNIMLLDEVDGPLHKSARNKFITILFKQLQAIHAEQVFIVSHNNTFDGFNVNIILTSDEVVDESPLTTVMTVN